MRLSFENEPDDSRQSDFVARLKERYESLIDDAQPDLVVVVGGDGAMLRALQRRTPKRAAPWTPIRFLGIGRGTLNFLMNPEAVADQLADLNPAALPHHRIYPLWVEQDGEAVGASYNEVVLGGGLMEWHAFRLESGDGAFDDYEIRAAESASAHRSAPPPSTPTTGARSCRWLSRSCRSPASWRTAT